jgi:hypothetical protein
MRDCRRNVVGLLSLLMLWPAVAAAQVGQFLPALNLGFTNFVDGGPPAGPGLYVTQYGQYWNSENFKNDDGRTIPLIDDLDVWISLTQFIYQSEVPVIPGGQWGIDVIVPLVSINADPGALAGAFGITDTSIDNNEGIGDVLVGPYFQFHPIMGENGPIFMHRIELQNLLPVGKYSDTRVLNPGSNFYSFNPYWSATVFPLPPWTISWRLHYLWNEKNQKPNQTLFPNAKDTRAGQAVHINFSTAYEILPRQLRAGLNGYYLKQFTASELNGRSVPNWKEQVLGLGPGGVWHFNQDNHLFFNAFFETEAESRPEGMRFNLRYVYHF